MLSYSVKKWSILCYFLIYACNLCFAQENIQIKGYIKNSEGKAVMGASIWIPLVKKGTTSDVNGYFELIITKDKPKLNITVSYIGKKTVSKTYNGEKLLNITLEDDFLPLNEVRIIAKPNINAIDIRKKTGSISVAHIKEIKNTPTHSIAVALQGKIPGLQIINRNDLGTPPKIRIRGSSSLRKEDNANQPLYILDGKMISAETFFYLNPENIQHIKVLKDAVASAIYGIKAANGVIEITSKRGKYNRTSVHMQTGVTLPPPLRVQMMNSSEKLELERLLKNEATPGYKYSKDYISQKYGGTAIEQQKISEGQHILDSLQNINTDWYKELASIQVYQKYDINYTENNDQSSYLINLGYLNQKGQLENNTTSRLSSHFTLDKTLSKKSLATLSLMGSYAKYKTPNGSSFALEQLIYQLNPYETRDSKKLYSYPLRSYSDLFNQFSKEYTVKNIGSSLSFNWKLSNNLGITAVTGIDYTLSENLEITPATAIAESTTGIPENARGTLHQSKNTTANITGNIRFNYNKCIRKHDITLGANADNYTDIIDNLSVVGHGLFGNLHSASAIDNSLAGIGHSKVNGKKQTTRNIGVGILSGYTYNKRYSLFVTYKRDAASILPKSKRWNSAYAIGISIDIKSYPFFENINWLKSFKIRGSWGNTANAQGIAPYLTIGTFQYLSKSYDGIKLMQIIQLPNKNLKAEQNEITDIGLSTTIHHTYFYTSIYKRTTRDALMSIPIASSSGFNYQVQNIGTLENKGVELGVRQQIISSESYGLHIGGNLSYNQNKVIDLYGKNRLYIDNSSIFPEYEVGQSTNALFGLKSTGINPITGLPEYISNKGQQVNAHTRMKREDFVYLGQSTPPVNGSFFVNIKYKQLQLNMDFYYSIGGVNSYSNSYIRSTDNANFNAAKGQLTDMWWQIGDENKKYHTAFYSSSASYNLSLPSDRTIVKTDFIRFSNLSIKYRLNKNQLNHLVKYAKCIEAGLNTSNIFTWSRFKDSDPETSNIISPLPPIITLNFNITF